MHYLPQTA